MYNLDGLRSFSVAGTHLGVVGFPITHSISPIFQNAALRAMEQEAPELKSWEYHKIEAPVEQLQSVIEVTRSKGFRGLNLTIPHKVEVLKFLDCVDAVAERMGAVNTLVFDKNGVSGFNSDGYGISNAIRQQFGIEIRNRPVVMLGAGGASRAACVQCLEDGCSELWVGNRSVVMLGAGGASRAACVQCLEDGCSELWVGNRSVERMQELLDRICSYYPDRLIRGFSLGTEIPDCGSGALLINATSLGLKPEDPMPVQPEVIGRVSFVYDMVYGRHTSALVKCAKETGLPASDGLTMLVHQGKRSLEIWTGKEVPVDVMTAAVKTHMQNAAK